MIKRYIATYVDIGDTCDEYARVLGVYKTNDDAKHAVSDDIKQWCENHGVDYSIADYDCMEAHDDEDNQRLWNIEMVDFE